MSQKMKSPEGRAPTRSPQLPGRPRISRERSIDSVVDIRIALEQMTSRFRFSVTPEDWLCLVGKRHDLLGPETRTSLLASLNDPASEKARAKFVSID